MLYSRILRTGLLCSPSLELQSPDLSWEACFNRRTRSCPSCSPLCSQTPGGRSEVARGSPVEDKQLFSLFRGWWHTAQARRAAKIRTSMKCCRALTKRFHSSLHYSLCISHATTSGESSSPQLGHPGQGKREAGHTHTLQNLSWTSVGLAPKFTFHTWNPTF